MLSRTRPFLHGQRRCFPASAITKLHVPSKQQLPSHNSNGSFLCPNIITQRGIITRSATPSPEVFIERPEVMVLAESSLYKNSWTDFGSRYWPAMGMHFASVDIMNASLKKQQDLNNHGNNGQLKFSPTVELKSLEKTLAGDLSRLHEIGDIGDTGLYIPGQAPDIGGTSAYAVLVARGPIQCLVAQYFLESMPLAGLVLVDPLLLPEDGRPGRKQMKPDEGDNRWKASLSDMISMLENKAPQMYNDAPESLINEKSHPLKVKTSQGGAEASFLHSLADSNKNARPLKLEAASVPVLVMYSGDHAYHDYYRIAAERTAAFHTCGGEGDYFDQVSVLKIQQKQAGSDDDGLMIDDMDEMMKSIYGWYEEVVA